MEMVKRRKDDDGKNGKENGVDETKYVLLAMDDPFPNDDSHSSHANSAVAIEMKFCVDSFRIIESIRLIVFGSIV